MRNREASTGLASQDTQRLGPRPEGRGPSPHPQNNPIGVQPNREGDRDASPKSNFHVIRRLLFVPAGLVLACIAIAVASAASPPGGGPGLAQTKQKATPKKPAKPRPLTGWVRGFTTTEYHPTPERWFNGPLRSFRGLSGRYRVAWLLSAHGIAMEGHGWANRPTGPGTRMASYVSGSVGWINGRGRKTVPGRGASGWSAGPPAWLACGWKNRRGGWTFPSNYLSPGERVRWANGRPHRWVGCNITLAASPGRALRYWNSVAVDPKLFPLGKTWFYIPAYRNTRCGGWFRADDTGGAVTGRHLDIYRPPPPVPTTMTTRTSQRILVVRGKKPAANPCR